MESSFSVRAVGPKDKGLIKEWLMKPHVSEWFNGEGLENTFTYLDDYLDGEPFLSFWFVVDSNEPVCLFMTSYVDKPSDELSKWCQSNGKTLTLDMLIGNERYLGKGLAHRFIGIFLDQQFSDVYEILIDPDSRNKKAIHVYQKAGFKVLGEFLPSYSDHVHTMMTLQR